MSASPGTYSATVRVVGYTGSGDEVDTTDRLHWYVPEVSGPSVRIDYLIDGLNGDTPWGPRLRAGDVATFTYIVTNLGSESLDDIAVSDDRHGTVVCPRATLSPGSTMVCSVDEVLRLQRTETWATVTAMGDVEQVSDSERLYYHVKDYGRQDELLLEVSIDNRDADTAPGPTLEVGRTVTLRYVVTNNANRSAMWSVSINDPRVPSDRMQCQGGAEMLGHYASMVCTATITVEQGAWSNLVTAVAYSNNGPRLDASDRVHYTGVL